VQARNHACNNSGNFTLVLPKLCHLTVPRGVDHLVERVASLILDLFEEHHVELVVCHAVKLDLGGPLGECLRLSERIACREQPFLNLSLIPFDDSLSAGVYQEACAASPCDHHHAEMFGKLESHLGNTRREIRTGMPMLAVFMTISEVRPKDCLWPIPVIDIVVN